MGTFEKQRIPAFPIPTEKTELPPVTTTTPTAQVIVSKYVAASYDRTIGGNQSEASGKGNPWILSMFVNLLGKSAGCRMVDSGCGGSTRSHHAMWSKFKWPSAWKGQHRAGRQVRVLAQSPLTSISVGLLLQWKRYSLLMAGRLAVIGRSCSFSGKWREIILLGTRDCS